MFYENRARFEKIALSPEGRDFITPKLCPRITPEVVRWYVSKISNKLRHKRIKRIKKNTRDVIHWEVSNVMHICVVLW